MFLICDSADTLTGMRLAGISGALAYTEEDFYRALQIAAEDKGVGILLINEKLAEKFSESVNEIKLNTKLPLLVIIPDREGSKREPDFISRYIKEAIGIKL